MSRTRVYVATTQGPVLIQRIVAEDALAEGEPSAVCLNGTTTRLPITGTYTYFVRDHVRGFAGRAAFRLDLDRRIDGGSSWMLGVWIAHVLLAQGRLAMRDEAAEAVVFATGEVAFGTGAERRTEIRAVGHVAEKVARLAERAAAEVAAGRRMLLLVPGANLPEARDAFDRLSAAVREKIAFCPVACAGEVRARLETAPVAAHPAGGPADGSVPVPSGAGNSEGRWNAGAGSKAGRWNAGAGARDGPGGVASGRDPRDPSRLSESIPAGARNRPGASRRRWTVSVLTLCLAFAATGGYLAWRSAEREWSGLWREGRYLDLAAALDTFPVPLVAGRFREGLKVEAAGSGALSITVLARRPADGGSCAGLRFRGGETVTVPVPAAGGTYRLDRPRALCGFAVRATAARHGTAGGHAPATADARGRDTAAGHGLAIGGHVWILLRREAGAGARDALLPPRRLVSGSPDRGPVLLSQDLPLYLQESWTWTLLAVRAPGPSDDIARALGEDGGSWDPERLERLRALGVTVVRSRIGFGR